MSHKAAIHNLVDVLDRYLGRFDGPGIAEVRAGIAKFRNGPMREVAPRRIDATRHVDAALQWMRDNGEFDLSEAILAAMPYLNWAAYDPYPREQIGALYAENHCASVIIGGSGQIAADDFDLGLFAFGPDMVYRDHHHAAPELYAPMTGPNGWRFSSGEPLVWKPAHQPVWNEAWAQHAFKSGPVPFLCVYGWTRDVSVPAKMIVEPDWPELDRTPTP